ncbi:hypothetical protein GCM10008098_08910 [Rhodanobacter panaciterrae]|uniref:DUF4878 domain-containing protein n=1 Tax=Rhodanobacter panaciterrae TaxID=490572 RepID=A0ABQ2ZM52_9GAMM|nr:hypothetical protein [Rhodanobacter panaciterrae]GGY18972.1 hypothetical protein GCM10008098_08910 [Rhodanobacter panaciterrae]
MRYFIFVVVLLLGAIAGCDQSSLLKAMTPSGDEQTAKSYIDLLREHKFEQIEQAIDPEIKVPNLHDALVEMAGLIPAQDPTSVKVVGANTFKGPDIYKSNITFEYQFSDKWLLANVAIQKKGGVSTIIGFNVNRLSDSLENLNKFKLAGKSLLQYAVLAGTILIPLFSLYALVLCARARIPKRKWLWIVFILFGIGKFAVNWTTGQWGFMPLSFQLFGAGAFAPLYGAWTLSISLPLGAIWFLMRRKSFSQAASAQSVPPELPPTDR